MGKNDGLSEKDIKQIKKDIAEIKTFIKAIERMKGEVPKPLKKSLNRLELAINTGKDIGDAATQASKSLRQYEKDLMAACKTVNKEQRHACEARVSRKYMARSVKWTLDPRQKDGVIENFIKKSVKRYAPEAICKRWDYCAKVDKAAK